MEVYEIIWNNMENTEKYRQICKIMETYRNKLKMRKYTYIENLALFFVHGYISRRGACVRHQHRGLHGLPQIPAAHNIQIVYMYIYIYIYGGRPSVWI